eukprot:480387-Pyramimonas_sp.AAC.1
MEYGVHSMGGPERLLQSGWPFAQKLQKAACEARWGGAWCTVGRPWSICAEWMGAWMWVLGDLQDSRRLSASGMAHGGDMA